MEIEKAPDIAAQIQAILPYVPFEYVDLKRVICVRSFGATSRARARIWGFPRIWQLALHKRAHYVIEVLSQHFDRLSDDDQARVIIHELMHIPKNFSGALTPHRGLHKRINSHTVERLFQMYKSSK